MLFYLFGTIPPRSCFEAGHIYHSPGEKRKFPLPPGDDVTIPSHSWRGLGQNAIEKHLTIPFLPAPSKISSTWSLCGSKK